MAAISQQDCFSKIMIGWGGDQEGKGDLTKADWTQKSSKAQVMKERCHLYFISGQFAIRWAEKSTWCEHS